MKSTAKKLLTTIGILVTLLISLAGCSSHSTSMEEKITSSLPKRLIP